MRFFLLMSGVLLAAAALSTPAIAQADILTGNGLFRGCSAALQMPDRISQDDQVYGGACVGAVATIHLLTMGKGLPPRLTSCPPAGATREQMMRVTVRFMNEHPEEMHQTFPLIIIKAFQQAFPCHGRRAD